MAEHTPATVVGIKPWFPWPLSQIRWLNVPVPAERLAMIRITLGLFLFFDILTTYLPDASLYFGRDSMGSPELFSWVFSRDNNRGSWSLLQGVQDVTIIRAAMIVWAGATACLVLGLCTRLSAFVAWVLAVSIGNINTYIDNSGDLIRTMMLFYLMLGRSGAALSLDSWLWRRYRLVFDWPLGWRFQPRTQPLTEPALIYPWVLRLIVFQMAWIYFANGYYKISGDNWPGGNSLYYVLGDLTLTRVSYAQFPIPVELTRVLSWTVLFWEVCFPVLFFFPWKTVADLFERISPQHFLAPLRYLQFLFRYNREITLVFGFLFHLGIGLQMEIGGFPIYMMCLYMQFLPWESWLRRRVEPSAPALPQPAL